MCWCKDVCPSTVQTNKPFKSHSKPLPAQQYFKITSTLPNKKKRTAPPQKIVLAKRHIFKRQCLWILGILNWLVVSTHLKNISQNGNLPQIEVKINKYLKPTPSKLLKKTHTFPKPFPASPPSVALAASAPPDTSRVALLARRPSFVSLPPAPCRYVGWQHTTVANLRPASQRIGPFESKVGRTFPKKESLI